MHDCIPALLVLLYQALGEIIPRGGREISGGLNKDKPILELSWESERGGKLKNDKFRKHLLSHVDLETAK